MQNVILPKTATHHRCQRCYRLHPLEYLEISGAITTGYRCLAHKLKDQGFYYIATFGYQPVRTSESIVVHGLIRELKDGMSEVTPKVNKPKTHRTIVYLQQLLV